MLVIGVGVFIGLLVATVVRDCRAWSDEEWPTRVTTRRKK